MPYPISVSETAKAKGLFAARLKRMDQDIYIVHVAENFVVLAGQPVHGTTWAKFDFLRRYLSIDG